MRFREVKLLNIPSSGLVCISGANESGKTTVRHLIYYILSGNNSNGDKVEDLINWECGQMRVSATLLHNHKKVEIIRQVDRDGSTFSKLVVDGEDKAQGNQELSQAFIDLFDYSPQQLLHTYLIDHSVLSESVKGKTSEHIALMSGLNPIKKVNELSIVEAEKVTEKLKELNVQTTELDNERNSLDYNASLELQYSKEKDQYDNLVIAKTNDLKMMHDEMEKVQHQVSVIEKEAKHIPTKFDGDEIEVFESECSSMLIRLNKVELKADSAKALKNFNDLQHKVVHFFNARKKIATKIEDTLSEIRHHLGIGNPAKSADDKDTIHARELNVKRKIAIHKRQMKFWLTSCILITLSALATGLSFVFHSRIMSFIEASFFDRFLHTGKGAEVFNWLHNTYQFSHLDGYYNIEFWSIPGVFILVGLFVLMMVKRCHKVYKNAIQINEDLVKDKLKQEKCYHQILAIDIKELKEAGEILIQSNQGELKECFAKFEEDNLLFAENGFNVSKIIQDCKNRLEEVTSALGLELHKIQSNIQTDEDELASQQALLNEVEPKLTSMLNKKTQHTELCEKLEKIKSISDQLKNELSINKYLSELSRGTLKSVLDRLGLTYTTLFKKILPIITSNRYRSVKMDDHFRIHVFSEDRSDFVPLDQLSSGTNDLLMLVLQIFLVHSFTESIGADDHFVFFDEPLLAVDSERYSKFIKLANEVSPILNQMFLCRPPDTFDSPYSIQTTLEQNSLIQDFSA